MPAWKRRVDATDYLEWREQVDPFRERPGVFFKALSLVVREWWVPRTELVTEVLAGIAGGLSGESLVAISSDGPSPGCREVVQGPRRPVLPP